MFVNTAVAMEKKIFLCLNMILCLVGTHQQRMVPCTIITQQKQRDTHALACFTNQLEDNNTNNARQEGHKQKTPLSSAHRTATATAKAAPNRLAEQGAGSVQGGVALIAAATANGLQETCGDFPEHFPRLNDELLQVLSCRGFETSE